MDMAMEKKNYRYISVTKKGDRPLNEDCVGVTERDGRVCFVVADGLGGHGKGEVASRLAVEAFDEVFSSGDLNLSESLSNAFLLAQKKILCEQRRIGDLSMMKTTAVALAMQGEQVMWGHIGDSRLYAFSRNKVHVRTLDHSVPQMLVLAGDIKEKSIRGHPDRNRLLRVLGVAGEDPRFELSELYKVDQFQAFLLCSDGFWELITEKEMGKVLKKASSLEEWLEQMCRIVEDRGREKDMDNYSATAIILQR